MLQVGSFTFKDFLDYYMHVMDKYFRKPPPVPTNIYLSPDVTENIDLRLKVARHCRFPSVINILANDENEAVRAAARENEYWILIGQYLDVLGFGQKERLEFARVESHHNLIVLLLFEDDLEIISTLFNNPVVSVKMLYLYMRLLKKRSRGRKDEQFYELARQAISEKKNQIIKISDLKKASRNWNDNNNVILALKALGDENQTVRLAVHNLLIKTDANILNSFMQISLQTEIFSSLLYHFKVISSFIELIRKREDLWRYPVSYLSKHSFKKKHAGSLMIGEHFNSLLTDKRLALLKACSLNLTAFENVILLTHCHVEKDAFLRNEAAKIMPLDQIINLVNDLSTPRKVFKTILSVLSAHTNETVQGRVRETLLRETRRLKESLKELEISVQAYFDIIFRSLGYNKIHEYQAVLQLFSVTEQQIKKFDYLIAPDLGEDRARLSEIHEKIRKIINENANLIYYDIGQKTIKELEYIASVIDEIFELKDLGLTSLRPGTPADIESEIKTRARLIWQSAISVYLGRIKDLTEMIRKKLDKVAQKNNIIPEFDKEIDQAGRDLEQEYKKRVPCNLKIICAVCSRRGCAAERFLTESHFFITELLDNFVDQ